MRSKQKKIQIMLILIGIFLILGTYFFNPSNKTIKVVEKEINPEKTINITDDSRDTSFEDVEYKGLYDLNKPFIVKSDRAHTNNDEPDVMYMSNMHVTLYLNDGRTVDIRSKKGTYNKVTYDCFFEKDVIATDGEIKIYAQNLELLATESTAAIYHNVNVQYPEGSLKADKVDYNFETKSFKVSMFDDKFVKMKVLK
tara:strand:+ start:1305 stop:1895 length:591 start_codon:yes stop_codon:yes gene_type:complete